MEHYDVSVVDGAMKRRERGGTQLGSRRACTGGSTQDDGGSKRKTKEPLMSVVKLFLGFYAVSAVERKLENWKTGKNLFGESTILTEFQFGESSKPTF